MTGMAITLPNRARSTPGGVLPATAPSTADRLCFDRFVLTPGERLLTRDDTPIEIGGRSFDLLSALVQQPGRVVPKRELLQKVWPGVVVEDAALRFHMTKLRKILGDGRHGARLITTQVGVGYAFVGTVRRGRVAAPPPPLKLVPRPELSLPSRLDRLIGREQDLRTLVERARAGRLLTIIGPGGVGKTSLAIEMAHDLAAGFSDGADFTDFAAVTDPDRVACAIAQTLGLRVDGDPAAAILDHLRDRRSLLVLDNCEHLVQPIASFVERIAAAAPGVHIMATSRQPLRARNESVHRLAPHALPLKIAANQGEALLACSAVELFLHQVGAAGGVIDADVETLQAIARMCRRLEGLALPIEVAAVRAATHGIKATADRLGDGLSLLWPGRRTAPPRQRTLRATLDWSYDLLSETGQRVLERLSTLAAPFSLKMALELVADEAFDVADASTAVDELAEKFLICANDGEYRVPELTRVYAGERLRARAQASAGVSRLVIPAFRPAASTDSRN